MLAGRVLQSVPNAVDPLLAQHLQEAENAAAFYLLKDS